MLRFVFLPHLSTKLSGNSRRESCLDMCIENAKLKHGIKLHEHDNNKRIFIFLKQIHGKKEKAFIYKTMKNITKLFDMKWKMKELEIFWNHKFDCDLDFIFFFFS